tara:strand:- start:20229 stop:21296 length:1068 start_codon:yes stop_codon:yes gene_type:complete
MKKLGILILIITTLNSCQPSHPKDYISISGKLENSVEGILTITGANLKKEIKIEKDGTFKDTLKITKTGFFSLTSGSNNKGFLHLKNGYSLTITGGSNNFYNSFQFDGNDEGADSNNLMVSRFHFGQKFGNVRNVMILEKPAFLKKVDNYEKGLDSINKVYKNANSEMIATIGQQDKTFFKRMKDSYDNMHDAILDQIAREAKLEKGKMAPEFNNYLDYKGGEKSLKDFRGNYVYIDVWATWCKPCIAQIPFLKQLEKEYKGKNLKIVSISTDEQRRSGGSWEKAKSKWMKMVKEKNLGGTQLWAGNDEQRFAKDYLINGIPRFILIDPKGKIVDANAPRPFDPKIKEYFNTLLK